MQASRKRWPYYIRAARAAWKGVVESRASPGGWPGPDYTWDKWRGRRSRIVGPPLAAGLGRPEVNASGGHPLRLACGRRSLIHALTTVFRSDYTCDML